MEGPRRRGRQGYPYRERVSERLASSLISLQRPNRMFAAYMEGAEPEGLELVLLDPRACLFCLAFSPCPRTKSLCFFSLNH